MINGFLAVAFMLAAILLSVGGFLASNPQTGHEMPEPPGFYWTYSTAAMIPVSLLTEAPTAAVGVNFLLLAFVATAWAWNARRKEIV